MVAEALSIPAFRRLVGEAGWLALRPELNGLDTRQRIEKDGVIFSAYAISKSPHGYGTVALLDPPFWAVQAQLPCEASVEDLRQMLKISAMDDIVFLQLSEKLQELKSYMRSVCFGRVTISKSMHRWNLMKRTSFHTAFSHEEIGTVRALRLGLKLRLQAGEVIARYRIVLNDLREGAKQ